MTYTPLGRTGLQVSRLALGCMSYGDPAWRPWILDERAAEPFFRAAIDAGINLFDTADIYSNGASEVVTGIHLAAMARREDVVIATKVYYPFGPGQAVPGAGGVRPNRSGLGRKHIIASCDESLRRLKTDYIDLYQIHRWDPVTPIEETLEALHDLVRAGKVRYIGASSGWAWRMMQALSISERQGWARFVSMQNHYNALYREEEREMLPLCRAMGVGVLPWSPLARGLLTRPRPASGSVTTPDTPRSAVDQYSREIYEGLAQWAVVDAVAEVAAARGVTMAEVALAWLLARPGVTAPIVGATRLSHLDAAVRALDLHLSDAEISAINLPYRAQPVTGHDA
jgi:aryl-alcohol dehydrogenase-like predicted oxidoreductase